MILPASPQPLDPAQEPLYAVVVVNTTLRRAVRAGVALLDDDSEDDSLARAFHYLVPPEWRSHVREGQLVWVPFGSRRLQGVIIGLDRESPVAETRELERIVDLEPVLSPLHIALAHWISTYYLAPLQRVMLSMLPPGIIQSVDVRYEALPVQVPEDLTEDQQCLLAWLVERGPQTARQLARSPVHNGRAVADQLVRKGCVDKGAQVNPPTVRPKLDPVIRLVAGASPDALSARALQQAKALAYLAGRETPYDWLPVDLAVEEAGVSRAVLQTLADKGLAELGQQQVWRDPLRGQSFVPARSPRLTPAQETVWQAIAADLDAPAGHPFLLQGVTGSGKTEIYLRAVQHALAQGRGAIVLVPEIALTPQTIRRFGARFPTSLAVMHSHLSDGERFDQWRRIRAGELRVVIGSRSAVFAPLPRLGVVILDEEHEWTYKQGNSPHYHARDAAVFLARQTGATCILGSATPALESAYRAELGDYVRLSLPQRIMGHRRAVEQQSPSGRVDLARFHLAEAEAEEAVYADLPPVEVIDMRAELRAGNSSIFSRALRRAIERALGAQEQIILFLNRRGTATFVLCRDCGHVLACPRCDVPLTYHAEGELLVCHHCNYRVASPSQCPVCWSRRIRFFGAGTQKVEEAVRQAFPSARLVRWDLDTTGGKLDHERILDSFIRQEADIMIGTQMIAKGLDLPRVTLVGVITADTLLHLPDFRCSERTFQLLTQVAGRAGRSVLGGQVIIQTYTPQHPAIQAAARHDYAAFYEREIAFRREHWYPPLSRLVHLVYAHKNAEQAQAEAVRLHEQLELRIRQLGLPEVDLIGPAPAFFARVRGQWRWHILIRGRDPTEVVRNLTLPLGWRVDVDPLSLL